MASTPAAAAPRGCTRQGVAGPWRGDGTVQILGVPLPFHIEFQDYFQVDQSQLRGRMLFEAVGPVALPDWLSSMLAESYTVTFLDGGLIDFSSNWGGGDGNWGMASYGMRFNDLTGNIAVDERGIIADCDHMIVDGDFYAEGNHLGTMRATYVRPAE